VQIHGENFRLVRKKQHLGPGLREAGGRDKHADGAHLAVADAWAKVRERVGARHGVPDADTAIMAGRYEMGSIIGPGEAVDGTGVCSRRRAWVALSTQHGNFRLICESHDILLVEKSNQAVGFPHVPDAHSPVYGAGCEDMSMDGGPGNCQGRPGGAPYLAWRDQRLHGGSRAEVDQTHCGVLRPAGDKEVGGDRGSGVRVDPGPEVEGTRHRRPFSGPELEGLVVRRRQERGAIKRVERQVSDAEAVSRRVAPSSGDGTDGAVGVGLGWVWGLLEVPKLESAV